MDWTKSMAQTFEYYEVDPISWREIRRIDTIVSSSIERNISNALISSADISSTEDFSECYIRIYLKVRQDGEEDRYSLGTFLIQTPSVSFDGKIRTNKLTAYSPLIELKDKMPPLGFTVMKQQIIMDVVNDLTADNIRVPIVETSNNTDRLVDNFVADPNDTWLDYLSSLMSYGQYSFFLDEESRILFRKSQKYETLSPKWIFDTSNSSILVPSVSIERDLYGIPNVLEVTCNLSSGPFMVTIRNIDTDSPISIPTRGREVIKRISNPEIPGNPTPDMVKEWAKDQMMSLNSLEYTVKYTHGYCPVNIGDCVRLDYPEAGLDRVQAFVIAQSLDCSTSCQVSETATYVQKITDENKLEVVL